MISDAPGGDITAAERSALADAIRHELAGTPAYRGRIGGALAHRSGAILDISPAEPLRHGVPLYGERMSWWRRSRAGDDDDQAIGANGRPLHTHRDRQAEAIRVALRSAGCAEFNERHGGFVVEAPGTESDPFLVCCTDDLDLDRHVEEKRYQHVLVDAGFRAVAGIDGDDGGLQVWPVGVRPRVPRPSPRAMAEDWLRSLTISGEPGTTPERALELIARVNQPGTLSMQLRTPLPPDDAQALDETLAWYADVRSRQAGVNLLVEGLLIGWLAEATGQDRGAILQRLALAVEELLHSSG